MALLKHGQLFSVLASNNHYYHPADGFLAANSLSCYLSKFLCRSGVVTKEIERDREHVSFTSSYVQHHPPEWVAVMKFKTPK